MTLCVLAIVTTIIMRLFMLTTMKSSELRIIGALWEGSAVDTLHKRPVMYLHVITSPWHSTKIFITIGIIGWLVIFMISLIYLQPQTPGKGTCWKWGFKAACTNTFLKYIRACAYVIWNVCIHVWLKRSIQYHYHFRHLLKHIFDVNMPNWWPLI